MRFGRHILLLLVSIGLLVLVGHVLPKALKIPAARLVPSVLSEPPPDTTVAKDTLGFDGGLQASLPVLKSIKGRGKGVNKKPDIWMLGNGISIPNYMLRAQRFILSRGGHVVSMEELHAKMPSAMLTYSDSSGNKRTVELRVGESFLDSASRIAVAFMVDTLTPSSLAALSQLDFTITLLVTPFDSSKALFAMLDQLPRKELVAWIPMEAQGLLSARLGANSIQIHHSESEIAGTIDEAFRRMPEAAGVATRYGQRAVEHAPLLEAVLKPLAKRKAWFWDLSGNRFSRTLEACESIGMPCKRSSPFNPDNNTLDNYVTQGLNLARKSGKAAIALPLNQQALDLMKDFKTQATAQGTEIVKMSTIVSDEN